MPPPTPRRSPRPKDGEVVFFLQADADGDSRLCGFDYIRRGLYCHTYDEGRVLFRSRLEAIKARERLRKIIGQHR